VEEPADASEALRTLPALDEAEEDEEG